MKESSEKNQNVEWTKEEIITGQVGDIAGEKLGQAEGKMGQDLRGELSAAQRGRDADESGALSVIDPIRAAQSIATQAELQQYVSSWDLFGMSGQNKPWWPVPTSHHQVLPPLGRKQMETLVLKLCFLPNFPSATENQQ